MTQNPMQLFQIFAQLKQSPNPMQAAQLMFSNNPLFGQAVQMCQGADINTKKNIVQNVAREKNMNPQELSQWAYQFGISL